MTEKQDMGVVTQARELLARAYQDNGDLGAAGTIRAGSDITPDTQIALLAITDALRINNEAMDGEALGEALFSLSARLNSSGFLDDAGNHAAYEKVVAAFQGRLASQADQEALRQALKWALPLAERAVDDHRLERLRCGHSDIHGTYKSGVTWAGIHQSEVDQIEHARAAIAATHPQPSQKGEGDE